MLNSFWGKFGQRLNMAQTEVIIEPNQLYELLFADDKFVNSVQYEDSDIESDDTIGHRSYFLFHGEVDWAEANKKFWKNYPSFCSLPTREIVRGSRENTIWIHKG
jgi:hypothetical protein